MSVASWCCACFWVVLCVSFCTGHLVMVPLNLTYLHCLQHSFFNISSIYIISHYNYILPVYFYCIRKWNQIKESFAVLNTLYIYTVLTNLTTYYLFIYIIIIINMIATIMLQLHHTMKTWVSVGLYLSNH